MERMHVADAVPKINPSSKVKEVVDNRMIAIGQNYRNDSECGIFGLPVKRLFDFLSKPSVWGASSYTYSARFRLFKTPRHLLLPMCSWDQNPLV
jgi:hypothetical protein